MKKNDRSLLFIDIFGGESETINEEEYEEKMAEAQPLIDFYNKQYGPSKEQLAREEENKHIMKTRMRLDRETIHVSFVQSFNDNYHRDNDDITVEDEQEVRGLRRRYPQYTDWVEAINIYNDYMQKLYTKYVSKEVFDVLYKSGKITEYVPPEPKIKPSSLNKSLKKNQIMLSPKSKTNEYITDVTGFSIQELLAMTNTSFDPNEVIDIKLLNKDKASKDLLKMFDQANSNKNFAKNRDKAMLNGGIDFINEYFETKSKMDKDKYHEETEEASLQDLLDDNFVTEEDLQNATDEMTWYNGMMVRKSALDEDMIYRKLNDMGWDGKKIFRNTVDTGKRGIAYELLKRADKKDKKERKKNKKLNKVKDDFMTTLIFDNNYDNFGEFEDDMLNMAAEDIFGEKFN
jgi:hypothetical protein